MQTTSGTSKKMDLEIPGDSSEKEVENIEKWLWKRPATVIHFAVGAL